MQVYNASAIMKEEGSMGPISKFSHDAEQYIYQIPNVRIDHRQPPTKPFELKEPEKPKKTKKDVEKRKQEQEKKDKKRTR